MFLELKKNGFAFVYAIIASIIAFTFFDLVFDDSYDAFASNISAFQFTDFSLFDQHYLGLLLIRDVMKYIQELLPQLNIFSSFYMLFNIASLAYTLITLKNIVLKNQSVVIQHFFYLLISLLFIENIVSITHTRFATVFAGVALLNIVFGKQSFKNELIHFSFFLFGFLARPESGLGAILVFAVAFLIFKSDIYKLINKLKLPLLACFVLIGTFLIHKEHTSRFEILIEPDIEYALSTQRIVPMSEMKTEIDSLRYELATSGMFIDTGFVSVSFLQSITSNQFEFDSQQMWKSIKHISYFYSYYAVFAALLIAYLLLAVLRIKNRWFLFKLLTFIVFQFTLLSYLDYNVAVADRHFLSLQLVFLLFNSYYFFKEIKRVELSGYISLILFVCIGATTALSLKNALGNQIQVSKDTQCLESALAEIEKVQYGKDVIVTVNTIHLFDKNYSLYNKNNNANNYAIYDVSNYSIVPRNLAYLSELCACEASDAKQFLTWANEEKPVFLIDDQRAKLISKYLAVWHKIDATFIPTEASSELVKPLCLDYSVYKEYDLKYLTFE